MEPYLSLDQKYVLKTLKQVGFLNRGQVFRLLFNWDHRKEEHHVDTLIRQLVHLRKVLVVDGTDIISAPFIQARSPDKTVLDCVDIMLDLGAKVVVDLSVKAPPFQLRFTLSQGENTRWFGVFVVEKGEEIEAAELIAQSGLAKEVTPILKLDSLDSRERLNIKQPCYFAVKDKDGYHYFIGGEANDV